MVVAVIQQRLYGAALHLAANIYIANCAIQCSIVCITIVCRSKFGVQQVICE